MSSEMRPLANVFPINSSPKPEKKKNTSPLTLPEKLKVLNENRTIKLRVNKTASGKYSFYLEYVKKNHRDRYYLRLYYMDKAGTKAEDKKAFKCAIDAREAKEDLYLINRHSFKLENKNLDIIFLDYFARLVKKRKEDKNAKIDKSWDNTYVHLKIFSKQKGKKETTFYSIDENYCNAFKEYLLESPG
jgi:integrase-like protein